MRALVDKGLIKVENFRNNPKKSSYLYILTPKGIEEKALVTYRFLKRKRKEYEKLRTELEELEQEVQAGLSK